jgi:serine/threonine-protein kinase
MAATRQGVILGTAAYMSPEQAKGKRVDRRADVWAFGAVFYEMLTGKSAFPGEDITDVLAAVVRADPEWKQLPANTPPAIRNLLRRCLEKNLRRRLMHIGEARVLLEDILSGVASAEATQVSRNSRERLLAVVAEIAVVVALLGWAAFAYFRPAQEAPQPIRLSADIGADASLDVTTGTAAILSPDGARLAFVARGADRRLRIYVRLLDELQAAPLSGTENARDLFFSPDGEGIGFFADSKLKKISVQGGAVVTLCDVATDRGGSWGDDGTIVFTGERLAALSKVSSAGGTPQPLTTLDEQAGEVTQRWPQVLPGSQAVLFTSSTTGEISEDAEIVVYSMASGQRKTVQRGGFHARYLPSGHIVYMREGTLFAVPFDLQRLEVTGPPAPILEGVVSNLGAGSAQFSFSETGNLVYVAGSGEGQKVSIYWMDREGKFTPLRETPGDYRNPAFSPDGKRLALDIIDGNRRDIWVYEWERDTLTRLTFAGEENGFPLWTPDGQRIVYSSRGSGGASNLWWIRADGAGNPQRLTESTRTEWPRSWHPDGKVLAFRQSNPGTNVDILTLAMEGDEKSGWKPGEPKPFVNSAALEDVAVFSPDGRWLAHISYESGMPEVYVRPFPGPGGKWQVSMGGGGSPKWSRNGRELFYRAADGRIMVVTYTASGDSFRADRPQLWSPGQVIFGLGGSINLDLHPDGRRFAVLKAPDTVETAAVNKVNIVLNWFEELKRRVPPGTN